MAMETVPVTSWATGSDDSWHHLKKGFKHIAVEYGGLSEKATKQAANEELQVMEELESFLTLLLAYRVSCYLISLPCFQCCDAIFHVLHTLFIVVWAGRDVMGMKVK